MRILMVCLGNICRSPLAEGILREKANTSILVDSAGTSSYHIGDPPDSRMSETAKKFGVSIEDLTARQFVVSDFDQFDEISIQKELFEKNSTSFRDFMRTEKLSIFGKNVDSNLSICEETFFNSDLSTQNKIFTKTCNCEGNLLCRELSILNSIFYSSISTTEDLFAMKISLFTNSKVSDK